MAGEVEGEEDKGGKENETRARGWSRQSEADQPDSENPAHDSQREDKFERVTVRVLHMRSDDIDVRRGQWKIRLERSDSVTEPCHSLDRIAPDVGPLDKAFRPKA